MTEPGLEDLFTRGRWRKAEARRAAARDLANPVRRIVKRLFE